MRPIGRSARVLAADLAKRRASIIGDRQGPCSAGPITLRNPASAAGRARVAADMGIRHPECRSCLDGPELVILVPARELLTCGSASLPVTGWVIAYECYPWDISARMDTTRVSRLRMPDRPSPRIAAQNDRKAIWRSWSAILDMLGGLR